MCFNIVHIGFLKVVSIFDDILSLMDCNIKLVKYQVKPSTDSVQFKITFEFFTKSYLSDSAIYVTSKCGFLF